MPPPARDRARLDELSGIVASAVASTSLPILAVYVHGSWATKDERKESDMDLAVLAERPLAWKEQSGLTRRIEEGFGHGKEIDMADLFRADMVFAALVVTTGDRVYSKGAEADRFEIKALASYARLNEERKGILADIMRRGTIYAHDHRAIK